MFLDLVTEIRVGDKDFAYSLGNERESENKKDHRTFQAKLKMDAMNFENIRVIFSSFA